MIVGVDKARDHDAVCRIDNGGVRRLDIGPDLADLAIFDQHVGLREIADGAVEAKHDPTLEQDTTCVLYARKIAVALRCGSARQRLRSRGPERSRRCADLEEITA